MQSLPRYAAYAMFILALITALLIGTVKLPTMLQSIIGLTSFFSFLLMGVWFLIIQRLLDHLSDINARLTWLLPPEYFAANPDHDTIVEDRK